MTGHLLAPDFFDAERAPLLSFESTEVRRAGKALSVSGVLTIKGVSVPVELEGTIDDPFLHPSGTERFPLHLETTIDRRAFGLDWQMELPNGGEALAWDVKLSADLFLVKE